MNKMLNKCDYWENCLNKRLLSQKTWIFVNEADTHDAVELCRREESADFLDTDVNILYLTRHTVILHYLSKGSHIGTELR